MIYVTRLNHTPLVLNAELIEHIEITPDTVISLTTGQKFMVRESTDEIIRRVLSYRRGILAPAALDGEEAAAARQHCRSAGEGQPYGQR